MSRLPLPDAPKSVPTPPETIAVLQSLETLPVTATEVKKWTAQDLLLSRVMDLVLHGGLAAQAQSVSPYGQYENELSVQVLRGKRVVIPPAGRAAALELLHKGHPGTTRMKDLARSFVWWPGMEKEIEEAVKRCDACQQTRHNPPPASLHPWEFPESPWERLHADFAGPMYGGKMFLIVVDAHSKWIEVKVLSTATSATTIEALRLIFTTHGIPKMFVSDNGPQFTSAEFAEFMKRNGIRHVTSAPYHLASNGLAERTVQTVKQGLKRQSVKDSLETRLCKFLLWYRLTPHSTTGICPAELLMGRRPRSVLDLVKPDLNSKVKHKQTAYHDQRAKDRIFQVGDSVYVRDLPSGKNWLKGTISTQRGPISFVIELEDGRLVRRHIDHVRQRTARIEEDADTRDTDSEVDPHDFDHEVGVPTDNEHEQPQLPDFPEASSSEASVAMRRSARTHSAPQPF